MAKRAYGVFRLLLEQQEPGNQGRFKSGSSEATILRAIQSKPENSRAKQASFIPDVREIGELRDAPILALKLSRRAPENMESTDPSVSEDVLDSMVTYFVCYYVACESLLLVSTGFYGFSSAESMANLVARTISASSVTQEWGKTRVIAKKLQETNDVERVLSNEANAVTTIEISLPSPNPTTKNIQPLPVIRELQNEFSAGLVSAEFHSRDDRILIPAGESNSPLRTRWLEIAAGFRLAGGWMKGRFINPVTKKKESFGNVQCTVDVPNLPPDSEEHGLDAVFSVPQESAEALGNDIASAVATSLKLLPQVSSDDE